MGKGAGGGKREGAGRKGHEGADSAGCGIAGSKGHDGAATQGVRAQARRGTLGRRQEGAFGGVAFMQRGARGHGHKEGHKETGR